MALMKLKDDPRLQGQWPPTEWGRAGAPSRGSIAAAPPPPEEGILVDVKCYDPPPSGNITLTWEHGGARFSAQIILDDGAFRHALYGKLRECIGLRLTNREIGELESNLETSAGDDFMAHP